VKQISDKLFEKIRCHLQYRATTYPVATKKRAFFALKLECRELLDELMKEVGDERDN
jgi:hypothetical protein